MSAGDAAAGGGPAGAPATAAEVAAAEAEAERRAGDRDQAGRRQWRILLSNIGYARGIGGSALDHSRYFYRYLWCSPATQLAALGHLREIIMREQPDVCCLIEIDQGSLNTGWVDQIQHLIHAEYGYFDVENKYGRRSILRRMPVSDGKSNAFLAREPLAFEKTFMSAGVKRLVYRIRLRDGLHLIFAHFSLRYGRRRLQFQQLAKLVAETEGDVIVMGDFNIFRGHVEIQPLLEATGLKLLEAAEGVPTFRFSDREMVLDLCMVSPGLAEASRVRVIEQPFSDHNALLLDVKV